MNSGDSENPPTQLPAVLAHSPVRVAFGPGMLGRLGEFACDEGGSRTLLVTDRSIRAAGHVQHAIHRLHDAFVDVAVFEDVCPNPTTETVASGLVVARQHRPDLIVALGGGSAMDCAKGVNLLLTNGGDMADYRGDPPADVLARRRPLLPMILIPTTAGTGSEAQSFALISDAKKHAKMACGDRRSPREGGLRPRVALLDPRLTWTQPPRVAAAAGIDAISHAIESAGSTARTDLSRQLSREAWTLLSRSFERSMRDAADEDVRAEMLLGAHLAGAAIENSMLGAAHACANPLTASCGVVHGVAVGLLLPHVIRFNAAAGENPYVDVSADAERLAAQVERFLDAGSLPRRLRDCGVDAALLPALAQDAAQQWTARFNPRAVNATDLLQTYQTAF